MIARNHLRSILSTLSTPSHVPPWLFNCSQLAQGHTASGLLLVAYRVASVSEGQANCLAVEHYIVTAED